MKGKRARSQKCNCLDPGPFQNSQPTPGQYRNRPKRKSLWWLHIPRPLYSCSLISSLRRTSLISSFQNDLIKSEGLKSEIWRWFIYFTLFRQGAKYSRIACSTARFMGFLPRRLRVLVFPSTLANNWNIWKKSTCNILQILTGLGKHDFRWACERAFPCRPVGCFILKCKACKNTSKVLQSNSR